MSPHRSGPLRVVRLAAGALLAAAGVALAVGGAGTAGAQESTTTTRAAESPVTAGTPAPAPGSGAAGVAPVDVVEVAGLVDRVLVDFVERSVTDAAADGSQAVILQMNTSDTVVGDDEIARLAAVVADSPVPVTIWVGPAGSRATGRAAQLLAVADAVGMAPGSRIGDLGAPVDGVDLGPYAVLSEARMSTGEARDAGLLRTGPTAPATGTPTLGDFLVSLDGLVVGGVALQTAEVVQGDDGPRQRPLAQARFSKLELLPRLMHTVASPPVAYLLVVIGLMLVLFEFFTAGVGVAGLTGAVSFVLGAYGVAALPTRWWAFGLLVAAVVAAAVDVQAGVPRFWTGVAVVAFVIGSVLLYDGLSLSWITLLVGIGGFLLTVLTGMPSMVRTRFATPTIGRDWLVGELGEATSAVAPEGTVRIREAQWRARTNRATPIAVGDVVRVVAIDGVTLDVEPEAGGARDYRERRPRS